MNKHTTFVPLIIVLLNLSTCSAPSSEIQADKIPAGGSFRVKQYPVQTIDPTKSFEYANSFIINQVFEGLIEYDVGLNLEPALSDFWDIDSSRTRYTFHLRPDVRFHNGAPVQVSDVVYTFERLIKNDSGEPTSAHTFLTGIRGYEDFVSGHTEHIAGITTPAEDTIQFTLSRPIRDFLMLFATDFAKIIPANSSTTFSRDNMASITGTGPFSLTYWNDTLMVLEKFPEYYRGSAHLDSVVIRQDPDYTDVETLEQFRNQKLDLVSAPYWALDSLATDTSTVLISRTGLNLEYIGFNNRHPLLRNKAARYAILQSIDWDSIYYDMGNYYLRATSVIPPGLDGFSGTRTIPRRSTQYKQYFLNRDDAEKYPITFSVIGENDEYYWDDYILMRDWEAAGVPIQLHIGPWEEFGETINTGEADIFSLQWIVDIPSTPHYLYNMFHSEGSANYFQYSNAQVDSLIENALFNEEHISQSEFHQIAAIVTEDLPFIPLYYAVTVYASRPNVHGIEIGPMGGALMPCEKLWFSTHD